MQCIVRFPRATATLLLGLMAVASAHAVELPKRKPGLWEITDKNPDMPAAARTVQQCIDEKTDNIMQQSLDDAAKSNCTKQELKKEGDKIVSNSVCKIGEITATTVAAFSGKFESDYCAEPTRTTIRR